jgi:hypothetical protein
MATLTKPICSTDWEICLQVRAAESRGDLLIFKQPFRISTLYLLHRKDSMPSSSGSSQHRNGPGPNWPSSLHDLNVLDAYSVAMNLISRAAGLDRPIRKRLVTLQLCDVSNISRMAATAASSLGRHDLALEWLEQGRCLV